ncbi:MAG: helix-turn-helix domain-containing protein [Clostridiales bacterium]|nr:helix-turn-helix domain-containing protein [Clostridiales bacterium]
MELMPINTAKQVADYLGVSESTISRLISSGKLRKIKALGKTRITKQAVEEFINK